MLLDQLNLFGEVLLDGWQMSFPKILDASPGHRTMYDVSQGRSGSPGDDFCGAAERATEGH
jgi:hypothetical protein